MSITTTDTMQSTTLPTKAAAIKASQPRSHRVRRGQKLDEVVSLSEHRFASGADASKSTATHASTAPSSSSTTAMSSSSLPSSSSSSSVLSSVASGPSTSSSTSAGGESPFQLQEYLAMLVRRDPHNVEAITSLPTEADIESLTSSSSSPSKGKSKDELPAEDDAIFQNVDTDVWVYEQLRRLVLDLTTPWLTSLQQECDKHLRPSTCGAMNAGDWMYLCASHGEEKQCCAIDYMVHTLDGATSLLNSARHFPSRTYVPNTSLRHFGSIARRLSRIFVHAWCYHKDLFLACEAETSLYSRFYVLVETYDLTATDGLPPRPNHSSTSLHDANASSGYHVDANEFSRATTIPAFKLNGTTAKRERSGTAASRSLLSHHLQQQQQQQQQQAAQTAPSEADAIGLVPPPAPSPRPTAILSRPEHEEGDAASDAPHVWSSLARDNPEKSSFLTTELDQDDDQDEEEEEEVEEEEVDEQSDEHMQKIRHAVKSEDEDATISFRAADPHAGPKGANGAIEILANSERGLRVDKEEGSSATSAHQPPESTKADLKAGSVNKENISATTATSG